MNEAQIETLVASIVKNLSPGIPFDRVLWNVEKIAHHLHRNPHYVRINYCCHPRFPKAIRLDKKGHPLYKAKEVCDWAESFMEK